jgi:hypothetical protein
MAAGAGFMYSAIKSLKDNKNLGGIRPKATTPDSSTREKNLAKADLKSIDESIKFRLNRYHSFHKTGYFTVLIVVLVLCWMIYTIFL